MLEKWQFNILFFVGVGGAVLLLLGPSFGLKIAQNPTAITGVGAILTYILTQKKTLLNKKKPEDNPDKSDETTPSEPEEESEDDVGR